MFTVFFVARAFFYLLFARASVIVFLDDNILLKVTILFSLTILTFVQ